MKKETLIDLGLAAKKVELYVGMVGRKLTKFVDTPGFTNPDVESDYESREFAHAILTLPNGVHAIGIVIKIGNISSKDERMLEKCLKFVDIVPYLFVIFSNAHLLSSV